MNNIIKELTSTGIFHNKIKLLGSFDNFIELNYVRVPDHFENFDLTRHALDIGFFSNFAFFKYFNSNL